MPFERSGQTSYAPKSPPGLLRAETCLHTLLSHVGAPVVDDDGPTIAAVVSELLQLEPAAVHAALRRLASSWAPAPVVTKQYRLTRREMDVAHLLALGKANTEIAEALSISEHTCRHHTERILTKLGVRSRAAVGASLRELSEPIRAAS